MKTKEDIKAEKVEAEARRVAKITVDLGLPGRPVMKEKTDSSITLALLRQGQKVLLLHPFPASAPETDGPPRAHFPRSCARVRRSASSPLPRPLPARMHARLNSDR